METEDCGRGSHQQTPDRTGALFRLPSKVYPRKSPKYERKFSQTFTKRQSPEWKPAVRRYSVETGQVLYHHRHDIVRHYGLKPESEMDFMPRSDQRRSLEQQTSTVAPFKNAVSTNTPSEKHDQEITQDHYKVNTDSDPTQTDSGPNALSRISQATNSDGQDVQSTPTDGQGREAQPHRSSRTTPVGTHQASETRAAEQLNKLTRLSTITRPLDSQSGSTTCCAYVEAGRPPAGQPLQPQQSRQQQQQQQNHRPTATAKLPDADRFGPCVSAAVLENDSWPVSVSENLQLQDKQRKHVILSMALRHLITPKNPFSGGGPESSSSSASVGQSACYGFRSRSCSFGPARSATEREPDSSNTTPSGSGVRDHSVSNLDRSRISEKIAKSASIFLVSSNLHQIFDRQQKRRLESLVKENLVGLSRPFGVLENPRAHDGSCQNKLQAHEKQQQQTTRQLANTSHRQSTATNSSMRQLVTGRLEEQLSRGDQSSSLITHADNFEPNAGDHRPKSTAAEQDAREPTPARRSCSAFGKSGAVNCDSLYSGLVSDQCELNLEALIVESWLDDHPQFTHDYFMRKAPRQMIDDWLVANAKVSNTNLSSQLDLRSINSMSRPISQLSLSSHLRTSGAPSWRGSETIDHYDTSASANINVYNNSNNNNNSSSIISNNYNQSHGRIRPSRSNSQSAAGMASSRALAGSLTRIRKISATDFETRSGSGFLRPMLSKTPDGRLTFLPQTSFAESSSSISSAATKMDCVPEQRSATAASAGRVSAKPANDQSNSTTSSDATISQPPPSPHARLESSAPPAGDARTRQICQMAGACDGPSSSSGVGGSNDRPAVDEANCVMNSDSMVETGGVGACKLEQHLGLAHDEGEVRMIFELVKNIYDDLDIRTLFHKILKNIAVLINADRSSLFLVCGGPRDPNRRLVSQLFNVDQDSPSEACDMEESITIPWGVGLVGYVAESGEAVNIVNCYEDPRFTDAIDQRTGYVTRHMLCAPILDKHNEIVGVAQVINKRDGHPFSKNDETKFKRYLQFCGIGLRNAQSYEQCQLENRRNQVLLDLARMVFEEQSTIEQVVHRIMLHTQSLLDCERCQVLLIDNGNDELDSLLQMPSARQAAATTHCSSTTQEDQPTCQKRTEWRPRCSAHHHERQQQQQSTDCDDVADDENDCDDDARPAVATDHYRASRDSASSTNDDLMYQQPQHNQLPPPRLFSLVFDLECDGDESPVVYDTRSGDGTPSGGGGCSGEPDRKNRAFPVNIGITGYVATTGETLNIEDAHAHERFDSSVDENTDFRHKSILCMPIRNGQRQIIGVIQLINKKNGQPFNKNDEDLFEAFAIFCGLGIHNTLMYERVLKVMAKQRVTFEVLSYHATAPLEEAKKLSQEQVPSCFALNLASLKFNDFSLDEQYMLKSCLRFFLDLDLMRRFQIDQLVFCNWILSVQKNYRKVTYHPVVGGNGLKASPVRYHNWRHAFNVSQMMFAILVNTQICHSLGELETLALMIACLCHDLDHRGTNNSFQIKSASPLAELYSTSTMEHHHFDQCVMILNSQGNQILSNLSPEEYSRVIMLLEEAILATDLANYFQKRDHFFQLVNSGRFDWRADPTHRSTLRCMLMTACDVAAITKPWPVQKVVADLVMSEFYQQGDIEKNELKIEPIDMMNRDKMSELPSMQISFIDTICAPIYTAFARLFPQELDSLLDGCLTNRGLWREVADGNTKPDIPLISYLNCDTDVELETTTNICVSKSDTNLPRKLGSDTNECVGIGAESASLSDSSDALLLHDLHGQASQETMIAADRCSQNLDSSDVMPNQDISSPDAPESHRNSL